MSEALASARTIRELESAMADPSQVQAECPVTHQFTPGLYIREIFIPAGTLLTSGIHRTEHPFVVSVGIIDVISENEGKVQYVAPHFGITKPNTHRVLYAHTDVVWTTFHPTTKTNVEEILGDLFEDRDASHMPAGFVPGYHRDLPPLLT